MILALPGALLIGLSLGLLGSGGSILTVPILVYVLGQDEKVAIASSLAIVGIISMIGAIPFARDQLVRWRVVMTFGVPGIIGTYVGAALSIHASGAFQMLVFAMVMYGASVFMLRQAPACQSDGGERSIYLIGSEGFIVGIVTGFVGVGGGFLIVPALVLLGGLTMQAGVATSLVIIAIKSLVGFVKYVEVTHSLNLSIDYGVIIFFSIAGIIGSLVGGRLACRLPQEKLKQGFGGFLILIATFVLFQTTATLIT